MLNGMIEVIGAGYVGLSLAVLFAQKHWVNLVDIDGRGSEKSIKGSHQSLIRRLRRIC